MAGELREVSRELISNLESQKLVSAVFSVGQMSRGGIGLPLEVGQKSGIWYVLIGRKTSSATVVDYMFYTPGYHRVSSERSTVLDMAEVINRKYDSSLKPVRLITLEESGESAETGFPSIMIDLKNGELMKGTNFNLGTSLDSFLEASTKISSNFPHPFHPDLDTFVKSLFLTRGLMLKPPLSRKFIMENLVEDAYQHSIGIRKETIRRDFQDILKEMVGSGVFRIKGAYVTYLTDFTEYRRRYQRKYVPYLDRISRRTIFDYESAGLDQ